MLFSPATQQTGLAIIRIITGALVFYHGLEIFDNKIMDGYLQWEVFQSMPAAKFMVYLGKALELVCGICFVVGIFTRVAAVALAILMLFICFKIGHGKFWYEDQHPFLFVLLAMIYFFKGPATGGWMAGFLSRWTSIFPG